MAKKSLLKPDRSNDKKLAQDNLSDIVKVTGDPTLHNLESLVGDPGDIKALLTSSFIYGIDAGGLVSTQQLKADFSELKNHTFFNSAVVNTNVAFDKVLNQFPFDGTRFQVVKFLEKLTGFERYIFDNFPSNTGFLIFSGGLSQSIEIADAMNTRLLFKRGFGVSGEPVIDPGEHKSFTIETQLFLPQTTTKRNQCIVQKVSGSNGISLILSQSTNTASGTLFFGVKSGSVELSASVKVQKNKFNHIVATLDRESTFHQLKFYVNRELLATTTGANFGAIEFKTSSLLISSGTKHSFDASGCTFTTFEPFSGALDELRIWHLTRSINNQGRFSKRNIFAQKGLQVYLKFNEPRTNENPSLIIDSSGHGLHSYMNASTPFKTTIHDHVSGKNMHMSASIRNTASFLTNHTVSMPLTSEEKSFSPILFYGHPEVQNYNSILLASASNYDILNPNLITKLVPEHYFNEGAVFENQNENIDLLLGEMETFKPKLGSAQILASFLYTIAKGLDELKIFIDQFVNILTVNLNEYETSPDALMANVAEFYGLKFNSFFSNASFRQLFLNENVTHDDKFLDTSLLQVRDQLWKRTFSNLPDILKSKGTTHAIESFMRTMGINPDSNFRIREFGGAIEGTIKDTARKTKSETAKLLSLSGAGDYRGNIRTHYLTASAMVIENYVQKSIFNEKKPPITDGTTLDALRTTSHLGLLTSQSFTVEQIIKFPNRFKPTTITQSISRMCVTGGQNAADSGGTATEYHDFVINLMAFSSSDSPQSASIKLYVKPFNIDTWQGTVNKSKVILTLSGADVFNSKQWNIAYGKRLVSDASSSIFLYAGLSDCKGEIDNLFTQSIYVPNDNTDRNDAAETPINIFSYRAFTASTSSAAPFLVFGKRTPTTATTASFFLNTGSLSNDWGPATSTTFDGQIGQIRFWTKALTISEFEEHTRNYKSIGTKNPIKGISFNTGSSERLIIDASVDQYLTKSDNSGEISIFDFSQNELHLTGTNFKPNSKVIQHEDFRFSYLSPFIDEAQGIEKVNIRAFKDPKNIILYQKEIAPVSVIPPGEEIQADPRFAIDFSIISALDEDIVNILSTLDMFNEKIGNAENVFSFEYSGLRRLRDLYFKRLYDKINLKSFFDFFVWFDTNIGKFISQLIPERVDFKGINFVIESHMLERPKFNYNYYDIYLGEDVRNFYRGQILLQQIVGILKRR
tara:strand:- start:530 stop:4138 length:3609 start_codon:yes stop_codon:yes gene_type:complete